MSPATRTSAIVDRQLVAGWGRAAASSAKVARVTCQAELEAFVAEATSSSTPVVARGLGRAYGDAAQCAGGLVLDCTSLDRIDSGSLADGVVRVEAGVSLDSLLRAIVPRGWFVPVTPGTAQVSIGGAIAADVHGKNHHRDGAFGHFVDRLSIVTPIGRLELTPVEDPEPFWATVGGMGLTGVVAEADLRLHRIESSRMLVDTFCAGDIDECMARLSDRDGAYRYSVAWVDCTARGRRLGRSVLSLGDHATSADLPARARGGALDYAPARARGVPVTPPVSLIKPAAILAANELWYRKARLHGSGELTSIGAFFYPLDAIQDWNRLYGPLGFTQYQFVVPFGAERVIRAVIELLQAARIAPSLAVLKRFGAADPAPMSFPMPGWTLALDIPLAAHDIASVLDRLDDLVASENGRVYLAKDGRLRPDLLGQMYPRLPEWLASRSTLDPSHSFASDLSRRLGVGAS